MKDKKMHSVFKEVITEHIKATRKELGLTQAEMATKLQIDLRTYCNIESGRSLCGTMTLLMYLVYICPDVNGLLENIKNRKEEKEKIV